MIRTPTVYAAGALRGSPPRPRRADWPHAFVRLGRLAGPALAPATAQSIALAIQNQEGYYPGSPAYQNNNPGNLVYAGQPGATPGAGGFAKFSSYSAGQTAEVNQIQLDVTRGTDVNGNPINNLSDLISSWAPPSENNTTTYIANVASQTGIDPMMDFSSLSSDSSGLSFSFDGSDPGTSIDLSSLGLPAGLSPWLVGGAALALVLLIGR